MDLMAATSAWDDFCGLPLGAPTTFFSPCLQHTAAISLHLLFLVIFTLQKVLTRNILRNRGEPSSGVGVPRAISLLITGWLCVFGGALSLALCCWRLYSMHSMFLQEVLYSLAQGVVFLVISASLLTRPANKDDRISSVLRAWWLVNFLITAILSLSSLVHFTSGIPPPTTILVDDIGALVFLPLAIWLAILALRVRVSAPTPAGTASEPLLGEGVSAAIPGLGEEQQSGYASASLWSLYTFHWISPLLKLGSTKALVAADVPHMGDQDRAEAAFSRFQAVWLTAQEAHPSKDPSVTCCLWGTFKFALIYTAILEAVKSVVMYAGPLLLDSFVVVAAGGASYWFEGYVLVAALFAAKSVETLASHQMNVQSVLIGMNVRSALLGALYQKGLRLSSKAKQRHSVGEIVNYMSTDAQRLAETMTELHNVWVLPLQIILALIILFYVVGFSMLAGLGVMVGVMGCNLLIAVRQQKLMAGIMECKDKRMKATTEVLNAMKIIKLYAWQHWFQKKVERLREKEMAKLYGFMFTASFNIFILWLSPLAVSVATFGTMLLLGEELTAGKVFTAIATFRILQEPLRSFPGVVSSLAQAMVSLDRIAKFLHDHDLEPDSVQRVSVAASPEVAIRISGATFGWGGEERDECLRNVSVVVPRGARVAICGSVGAGKSSLLACMLGEMDKHKGSATVSGTTAYVAQTAWIQNGTIQENILFGKAMEAGKYAETLRCCALIPDLDMFSHGDKMEIGERGINLSGGQKQRIQLARAVYQESDIYLLDDPFSAVDAHTGTELFMKCIVERLGEKTVVLVTHQLEFLPAADLILVLKEGAIVQSGRYHDLLAAGTDFGALVTAHNIAMETVDQKKATAAAPLSEEAVVNPPPTAECEGEKEGGAPLGGQLIADEEQEVGSVSGAVYWAYLTKALGGVHVPLLLLVQFLWQVLQIGSDWWLARYTFPPSGTPQMSTSRFFQVYTLLAIGSAVFVLVRTVIVSYSGLKTTQAFYSSMLTSIFRAPMAFFDATPIGRILSRSSSDQATIDIQMPFMYGSLLAIGFALLGILTVTSAVTWPTALLLLPMTALYLSIQSYFLHSSRELARVNGLTKAPIIAHFAESISGASTIRAFQSQLRFAHTSARRVDANAKVFFHYWAANEWMGLRLEMIGATVLCFSALMIVLLPASLIDPGLAGLSLSYGLALSQALFYVVWIWCTLENEMVSVERIQQYSDLATEAPLEIQSTCPPPSWPLLGTVELQRLKVRYRSDLPLVLKGISVVIPGGCKLGIVGRTGSGKSTIIQALFRVVEASGGCIFIDGVDISSIGLRDLRTRLALIPQEPTLFEGTVRVNLDPLGQYTDEELWKALDKCQLGSVVREKDEKLEAPVQEGGENWSVGQRQLFCLGRALLKKSRILVLDEATASVDTATDAIIQSTIRENFSSSTVISIAHRIPTVIDSDHVLVLDQGEVAEYNSPANLLEDRHSMFSKLVGEYAARSSGMAGMARNSSKDTLAT